MAAQPGGTFDRLEHEARAIEATLASERVASQRHAGDLREILGRLRTLAFDLEEAVGRLPPPAREGPQRRRDE